MPAEPPIWLIGCGNMGFAMLRGWLDAGIASSRFFVVDPQAPALPPGVTLRDAAPAEGFGRAIAILAIKPQGLDQAAPALAPLAGSETAIVSILAGVEIASLRARFADAAAIVRIMPNLPAALRKGALGIASDRPDDPLARQIAILASLLGAAEWIEESLFDLVTALSGSGPGFVYRFVEALAEAGATLGLEADQARRLAVATVAGAGALAAESNEDPGTLADRVASPGGTTRAGFDVLDRDDALKRLVRETLEAAMRRSAELAANARNGS